MKVVTIGPESSTIAVPRIQRLAGNVAEHTVVKVAKEPLFLSL